MAMGQARIPSDVAQRAIAELITEEMVLPPVALVLRRCRDLRDLQAAQELADNPRAGETLHDLYGSSQAQWVYCFRCDQAISLAELGSYPCYAPGRGLQHRVCPRPGTAPVMSAHERLERAHRRDR